MSKRNVFVFIIFVISFFTCAEMKIEANNGETKTRIAILPFSCRGNINKDLLELLSENFGIKLIEIGEYTIVERSELNKALNELKFQKGDAFDDKSAVEIGKLAGAQMVIIGTVTLLDSDYFISVKGIDLKTGIVVFAKGLDTNNRRDLVRMVEQLAVSISKGDNSEINTTGDIIDKSREKLKEKEKAEKLRKVAQKNSQIINRVRFVESEINFIDRYYNKMWGFTLDDGNNNFLKYRQSIGGGIALAVSGTTIFLGGLISMVAVLNYSTVTTYTEMVVDYYDRLGNPVYVEETVKKTQYYRDIAAILGGSLMPLGAIFWTFSAIPFYFAYKVYTLYKKTTGKKLALFEKIDLDIGFAMCNDIFNKNESRLNISMSIKL